MKITQSRSILGIVGAKVKVMAQRGNFSPFTAIQNVRSHNSTLLQARKLILSVYVCLIIIYKFYKYRHT